MHSQRRLVTHRKMLPCAAHWCKKHCSALDHYSLLAQLATMWRSPIWSSEQRTVRPDIPTHALVLWMIENNV
jgi:hypothetical protein